MSSYIFNSDLHRRYVLGLLALVLISVSGLFGLGVYLQPLYGDLTRIGAYAEKDFGWNKPQLEFLQPMYKMGKYDRYYDVVVLGDSFSTRRPRLNWQNYLVAATGWSVVTLDINKIQLKQVLGNRIFRETPPNIFILETVERELPRRLADEKPCDVTALLKPVDIKTSRLAPVHVKKLQDIAKHVERATAWNNIKLGFVLDYLWKGLLRTLFGDAHTDAAKVEFDRQAPFSSSIKQSMLVYKDDFRKVSWWREMGVPQISCRIERMRESVEANGHTRFVLMAAPDKLTAYAAFVRDKDLRNISALSELSGYSYLPEVMPRVDLALISAIHAGKEDVYQPDDTHWGSNGYQLAAESLFAFLRQPPYPSPKLPTKTRQLQ